VTQEAYDGAGELTTFSVPTNTGTYQFDVAFIPKGKFWTGMKKGSGTEVTLTKDYYLGTTEVTNAQYAAFLNDMGVDSTGTMPGDTLWIGDSKNATNGWKWSVTYVNGQWQPMPGYDNYPVYAVSWYGAVAYCNWLDSKISGYHFSLPTEAQWERAALCGTPYAYNGMGDTWNDSYGWGTTNSGGHPHDVGTSTSNIWNIYDMHGNIWEWCSDYVGTYPSSTTDPTGSISGTNHVIVSGSWDDGVYKSDAVYLNGWPAGAPGINSWDLGFRICAIKDPTHIATPLGGTIRKVSVNTTSGALNFQLAFIPKGKFLSGTTTGTEITLTKDYYMGTTEVTNAQFAAFLNDAGIGQDGKMPNDSVGVQDSKLYKSTANSTLSPWGLTWSTTTNKWEPCSGYDNFPAIEVNWYGAKAYCDWLNTKRPGLIFKLPTEAQWQYADQSGTQYEYNGLSSTWNNDYGWTSENSSAHTHEIGTALQGKNRWNLQDMSGNVREWCNDWYNSTYPYPTATDPVGAASSTDRVRRGNCWYYNAANSPAHVRGSYSPMTGLLDHYGFRVCAMAN
ncbi:MAG: formylglycine-generating enzyme family protein, partial [Tannerella sp.]|jgi:formylglycine-generating enzyme required for sulfatase activity|nr:formylglycine-generating enzyme family protein [Tannerella sp.]